MRLPHLHENKWIVVQIAVVVHIRLHAPVKVKYVQQGVVLEEATEVPAKAAASTLRYCLQRDRIHNNQRNTIYLFAVEIQKWLALGAGLGRNAVAWADFSGASQSIPTSTRSLGLKAAAMTRAQMQKGPACTCGDKTPCRRTGRRCAA